MDRMENVVVFVTVFRENYLNCIPVQIMLPIKLPIFEKNGNGRAILQLQINMHLNICACNGNYHAVTAIK